MRPRLTSAHLFETSCSVGWVGAGVVLADLLCEKAREIGTVQHCGMRALRAQAHEVSAGDDLTLGQTLVGLQHETWRYVSQVNW